MKQPQPSLSTIGAAQNQEANLRSQLAGRRFYRNAKRWHYTGASLAVVLALASPLVLLYTPDTGPLLGAVAGGWIFVSRLVLEPIKRELMLKGAAAQEHFDCAVLGLDWNEALVRRLSDEEIRSASGAMQGVERTRDWYPTKQDLAWPKSVLVCQRSNAVWARRQHRAYARLLLAAAVVWGVLGAAVALIHGASLSEYLVTIALPSLPAMLDASEFSKEHSAAAQSRQILEDQADQLLRTDAGSHLELREIQDQLFGLRRQAPLVPEWFYNIIRPKYEENMQYAADRASDPTGSNGSKG